MTPPKRRTNHTLSVNGQSLKDLIRRRDECLEKGYYWESLRIKKDRLVDYEIFYAKLLQVAVNGREIVRNVAGSPMVKEGGECVCGVFSPEGYAVTLSAGVLLHVFSMSEVIRFMAANDYEINPGIKEGDFFFNNDPHCGGQHAQDQFVVTPVFCKGKLVAWVGGMSHESETGATGPCGYDPQATNRYYEGLLMSPTKIASNDTLHTDYRMTVEHGTRDATYWLMDLQAKMSSCIYMRQAVKELVDQYGADFYLEAAQEIIQDGMQSTLQKIKHRFNPGKYRARCFADAMVPGRAPKMIQVNTEMTVDEQGHVEIDLEGCSREGPWPWNGPKAATKATFFLALCQILSYDCKFNAGAYFALRTHIPEQSIFACSLPAATTKYIGGSGAALVSTLFDGISRMYYAGNYPEEVVAGSPGSHSIVYAGIGHLGKPFAGFPLDNFAKGSGGQALRDGGDVQWIHFNPEGNCGDIEITERTIPLKYLGRAIRQDGGGFGKYRGGHSNETVTVLLGSKGVVMNSGAMDYYVATSQGLMGGYPSPAGVFCVIMRSNLKEIWDQKGSYPVRLGSPTKTDLEKYLKGKFELYAPLSYPNTDVKDYDLFYTGYDGGAGFGDPLERPPELVINDLVKQLTSERSAREIYGVVIKKTGELPQDLSFEEQETKKLRDQMRESRKSKGIPAATYMAKQKERVVNGALPKVCADMINELLEFSPTWAEWFKKEWGLRHDFKRVPIQD